MGLQRATGGGHRAAPRWGPGVGVVLALAPLVVGLLVAAESQESVDRIVRVVLRGNVRATAHRIQGQMRL
ncbi:MAG: hypothetical protein IMZ66_10745, partial [Planctomycetes bacterium]|nr:hypothetical protein [Planctomycetota bacterium]